METKKKPEFKLSESTSNFVYALSLLQDAQEVYYCALKERGGQDLADEHFNKVTPLFSELEKEIEEKISGNIKYNLNSTKDKTTI